MVFSSILFILYFLPIFLIVYHLVGKKYKNYVLLISSIFFYSWGAPKFIFVILGTTLIDFQIVKWMGQTEDDSKRKKLLTVSVFVNIGLLFYFKYCNFFIENVNALLSGLKDHQLQLLKVVLPIGISFYTFETITYLVDVYRKLHKPLLNFKDYLLYILFFPKLIAGPIVRYHDLADQITDRTSNDTIDNRLTGFYRFAIGLAKKVLIANQLGVQADAVFAMQVSDLATFTAWIGILAYTFQIYFDFSGYSDMAIGIAKMVGFKIPENFDNPYTSRSITEFWRRWHISLGNWMRNYLYIPLGGNKVDTKARLFFNLWIVFLLSGFWHGASWGFIIWGAYHGVFLILDRLFLAKTLGKVGGVVSTLFTFLAVAIGWVFFREEKVGDAFLYIQRLFRFDSISEISFEKEFYIWFIIAVLFSFLACFKIGKNLQNGFYFSIYSNKKHFFVALISLVLVGLSVSSITSFGFNPFIYFRF